jgi:hypothetical protein
VTTLAGGWFISTNSLQMAVLTGEKEKKGGSEVGTLAVMPEA